MVDFSLLRRYPIIIGGVGASGNYHHAGQGGIKADGDEAPSFVLRLFRILGVIMLVCILIIQGIMMYVPLWCLCSCPIEEIWTGSLYIFLCSTHPHCTLTTLSLYLRIRKVLLRMFRSKGCGDYSDMERLPLEGLVGLRGIIWVSTVPAKLGARPQGMVGSWTP